MGHHLLTNADGCLAINDATLFLIKHFALVALDSKEEKEISSKIRSWSYEGPGVWVIDESVLYRNSEVLNLVEDEIRSFGSEVPIEYLNSNVNDGPISKWKPITTEDLVIKISEIRRFCGNA